MPSRQKLDKDFYYLTLCCSALILLGDGCNKLVQVPNPISSVTTNQVFSTDATATDAMMGIYSYMIGNQSFSTVLTTTFLGTSADELTDELPGSEKRDLFLSNNLTAQQVSTTVLSAFWQPAYFDIYSANAVIAGVQASTGITNGTRNQLTGEAKFIRAYCYFYLTNIFGEVPLVLTPDFNQTVLLQKSSQSEIYKQIVSDLLDAQNTMVDDFSLSNGMPVRANKWAATALLARVFQYQQEWPSADSAANAVINSGLFSLVPLPVVPEVPPNVVPDSDAFTANSKEAILQLQLTNVNPYATQEGNYFVPTYSGELPNSWLTSNLLSAFENNDLRRANWIDSTMNGGTWYYYPYKYKINFGSPGATSPENYTLLRFAEQYLIRAEAEAMPGTQQNIPLAIADINTIRSRAGLPPYSGSTSPQLVLSAIQQEYRVEFIAEWGHRWMDLKRWGIAIDTLSTISYKAPYIDSTQLLYPIPISETQTDPNLTQNPGY